MGNKLQINFFYVVLAAVAILTFFVFLPYFQALFLAAVFSVVMYPFYHVVLKWCFGAKNIAAFLEVVITFVLVVVPVSFVIYLLVREIQGIYAYVASPAGNDALLAAVGHGQSFLGKILPNSWVPQAGVAGLQAYFAQFYGWVGNNVAGIATNTLSFLAQAFVFVLGWFFFLRDGEHFRELFVKFSPLKDAYDERILDKMASSINSVVAGSLLVALIQGVALALGMYFFHLQSPVIWGVICMLASLLPGLGSVPVVAILTIVAYFTGGLWPAIGFLAWGGIVVGLIDNVLRPVMYERGINVHSFLILLSIFGGIGFFGPLGFLIGPIVLALLVALLEIHGDISHHRAEQA